MTAEQLESWARREGLYSGLALDPRDAGDIAVLRWLHGERRSVAAVLGGDLSDEPEPMLVVPLDPRMILL